MFNWGLEIFDVELVVGIGIVYFGTRYLRRWLKYEVLDSTVPPRIFGTRNYNYLAGWNDAIDACSEPVCCFCDHDEQVCYELAMAQVDEELKLAKVPTLWSFVNMDEPF